MFQVRIFSFRIFANYSNINVIMTGFYTGYTLHLDHIGKQIQIGSEVEKQKIKSILRWRTIFKLKTDVTTQPHVCLGHTSTIPGCDDSAQTFFIVHDLN